MQYYILIAMVLMQAIDGGRTRGPNRVGIRTMLDNEGATKTAVDRVREMIVILIASSATA